MPQDGSDLVQRGAGTHHHGSRTVPKKVRTVGWRIFDASPPKCSANDVGNGDSGSEGAEGSICAEKHPVNVSLRACMLNVVQNRISCILWQRQADIPASLAAHQQRGLLPIDISGAHAGNVARPEPKPKQQQYDRTVPPSLLPIRI